MLEAALQYARSHRDTFLEHYRALLAIPSISTLPEHHADVQRAAQWLADALRRLGMPRVEVLPTPGHPIVYAEQRDDPAKPALLVYGHYDVQPADPLDEWRSHPFEPTVRGDNLYARGASDMKGSLVALLKAIESVLDAGSLPIGLRILLEGEEEIGSPSLPEFIERHRELLAADVALNCDGQIHSPTLPSIVYGLRGLAYFEITVCGPRQDLHSGMFGGAIHNPAQALCELVAGMHDAEGRVTLPGFYDPVRPLSDEERQALARIPQTEEDWQALTGAPVLWGERGYTTTERVGARPTLEVNGIVSGFTGEGAKTVLPAKAMAKISTRLVADQDPAAICGQIREYMRRHAPNTVTWEVRELSRGPGAIMQRDSPAMRAAVKALRDTFGVEPIFKREGGSVPVVGLMQQQLGLDSIMLGFGLPDDNIHGPNEKQHLPTFFKGVETYIRFILGLAANP
jgi:acetylornithine deacetylase/succinyl-diaminopimelate desuccinylase-like protein